MTRDSDKITILKAKTESHAQKCFGEKQISIKCDVIPTFRTKLNYWVYGHCQTISAICGRCKRTKVELALVNFPVLGSIMRVIPSLQHAANFEPL